MFSKKENPTLAKIMKSSYELFATHGYEKTSMSMIANNVKIKKASLYYYFSSKEELFHELFKLIMNESELEKLYDSNSFNMENFREKLIRIGYKEIDYLEKDPLSGPLLLEYIQYSFRNPKFSERFDALSKNLKQEFIEIIKKGIDLGVLPKKIDIILNADIFSMTIDALIFDLSYGLKMDAKKIWKETVDRFFLSLSAITSEK
ncbi:MAG: TetR/AcrR family transcriptional regulator [archaeon]|nr:TetR/AcrR family transcriptional regulator [archaeon]